MPLTRVEFKINSNPGSSTGAEVSGPPMKTILGDALAETP